MPLFREGVAPLGGGAILEGMCFRRAGLVEGYSLALLPWLVEIQVKSQAPALSSEP